MPWKPPEAPKCPRCNKSVYAAEKITQLGRDWHKACLRCAGCDTPLAPGNLQEHEGQPYCKNCYAANFGPGGYGRGGTEAHKSFGGGSCELKKN